MGFWRELREALRQQHRGGALRPAPVSEGIFPLTMHESNFGFRGVLA